MKIIGIICEYNPFHLGHLYQINEIKKLYNDCLIAIVIPSCFMQRGQVSIINKWDKTKIALEYGIDLVLELPFVYSTQAADIFASGALQILNAIKIDTLIFGSESNNVDSLKEMANYQLNNENYDKDVKTYLNKGLNYPTAMSMSLKNNFGYNQ